MFYLKDVKNELERSGLLQNIHFSGCSIGEIEQVEKKLHAKLPVAFKEFLLWMGHYAGPIFAGSDYTIGRLISFQKHARELLEEDGFEKELPSNAFVFFMHQGYQFGFFSLEEGDDPPVYWYPGEGDNFVKNDDRYSNFVLKHVIGYEDLQRSYATRIKEQKQTNSRLAQQLEDLGKRLQYYEGEE